MYILLRKDYKKKYKNFAFCLGVYKDKIKVENADNVINFVHPDADYFVDLNKYVLLFMKVNVKHIADGFKYRYYSINGKIYESIITNPYKELKKIHRDKEKINYKQLSLFDI